MSISTNCFVGKASKNGDVRFIYVHFDGFIDRAGKMLSQYYNTDEKVNALLDFGDCKSITEFGPEPFDGGGEGEAAAIVPDAMFFDWGRPHIRYFYLFEDGKWTAYDEKHEVISTDF